MEPFTKVVTPGYETIDGLEYTVFCTIQYKAGKLSITGVVGPFPNGNCKGGCGQISLDETTPYEGFPLEAFKRVWERWHLNDLRAGTPAQEEYLRRNPPQYTYPKTHYVTACAKLKRAGLNPDTSYFVEPYLYGTKWLTEMVPESVLEWLKSLPEAGRVIPPCWA